MPHPTGNKQITDVDWGYVLQVARKTQDCAQRNLVEIIGRITGREHLLPAFPGPEKRGGAA